jgi:hypothetical protein
MEEVFGAYGGNKKQFTVYKQLCLNIFLSSLKTFRLFADRIIRKICFSLHKILLAEATMRCTFIIVYALNFRLFLNSITNIKKFFLCLFFFCRKNIFYNNLRNIDILFFFYYFLSSAFTSSLVALENFNFLSKKNCSFHTLTIFLFEFFLYRQ